jgi:hypothetical protein
MFARVKYLCDYGTEIATLFAQMCCEASDDMLFVSLFFHRARGLFKNHRTPKQLCCPMPNAPVQYQSSSIITMIKCHRSSWEITGSYYALKEHSASSQGDHFGRVHSDQMVLEMIRRGRLVW